jgi:hypothetical protein
MIRSRLAGGKASSKRLGTSYGSTIGLIWGEVDACVSIVAPHRLSSSVVHPT